MHAVPLSSFSEWDRAIVPLELKKKLKLLFKNWLQRNEKNLGKLFGVYIDL